MRKLSRIMCLILAVILAGCGPGWIGPPVDLESLARGRVVWQAEECSACHGETGEGTLIGPSLAAVADHWETDALAEFLKNPASQLEDNPRLRDLRSTYDVDMPGVRHADHEQVQDLVVFLLHGID